MALELARPLEAKRSCSRCSPSLAVAVGGLVLLIPPYFLQGTIEPIAGREAVLGARARGARPLHPRRLQHLPQPAGAPVQDRDRIATGPSRWPARASTTAPSCGARGARVPISRASAASTRTPGTGCTCATRARSSRARTCRFRVPRRSSRSTSRSRSASSRCCAASARPTPTPRSRTRWRMRARRPTRSLASLRKDGVDLGAVRRDSEAIALIAYLQHLGRDIGWREQPIGTASLGPAR